MLSLAVAVAVAAAPPSDDRLVLQAPNLHGQQGLLRTTSALVGGPTLGLSTRAFVTPDFLLPDLADANTFLEGTAVAGTSFFDVLELAVQLRAAANLNAGRAAAQASVGDLTTSLKAGTRLGLFAIAGSARVGLPTRSNKVGFDLGNLAATAELDTTFDLQEVGAPLRLHVDAGYTLRSARFAGEGTGNPYLLDGPDGALLALATQQWFHDTVQAGVGVEVPLPYVSPFVEVWYQTALGAADYDVVSDAWLTVTPGARVGVGGVRIDVALDLGLTGNAGGVAPDIKAAVEGQPLNPLWAARVGVSHAFDVGGGGGSAAAQARVEGCVTDAAGPVAGAAVALTVDGQPGPRLLVDDRGCWSLPVQGSAVVVAVSDDDHASASTQATVSPGQTTRADVVLTAQPRTAQLVGFVTNKDDEPVDAALEFLDDKGQRTTATAQRGAFDATVTPGRVRIVARADGYLLRGRDVVVDAGDRRAPALVLRKVPKKRSATLAADHVETTARVPFEFKTARLLSTSEYLLDEIADLLLSNAAVLLSIEAHTDVTEVADASDAKALTTARAKAVRDALIERGVDGTRLQAQGYGVTQPLGPNDPKNRRVEFVVVP
jgi:outer membrane protein OmpA-like peptidoglycan-associated protein